MKLKYYLRGLGTGILFATIILFISYSYRMSDSQVKKRAEELGMVYAGATDETTSIVSESVTNMSGEENGQTSSENNMAEEMTTLEPATEDLTTGEPTSENTTSDESTSESTTTEVPTTEVPTTEEPTTPQPTTSNGNVEKCELTVTRTTSSNDVAYALANAGIIDDAEEFNDFLCNNGYDRKIQNGTYTITSDMSYEDIAKIITTRRY